MVTTLNPNAAEFVPSSLRSTNGNTKASDSSRGDLVGSSRTAALGRSESSVSNNSDDEAHQYWRHQLPDDITPDFNFVGEDDVPSPKQLSLAGLSIHGGLETSRLSASRPSDTFGNRRGKSPLSANDINTRGNLGYSGSYTRQFITRVPQSISVIDGNHYTRDLSDGFHDNMIGNQAGAEDVAIKAVEILASHFPGYSADSLADIYYTNGCDLHHTIRMLGQLELQGDSGFSQNLNLDSSNVPSIPSLSRLDVQPLLLADGHNRQSDFTRDLIQVSDSYKSTSNALQGSTDYASIVRKVAPNDSTPWKHVRNNSVDSSIGSRSSQLARSYSGHGKMLYEEKSPSSVTSQTARGWLDTGEAVADSFSPSREEARNLELLRNACLEQASQAYLSGNKALAKELSEKGYLYNMQLKAAQLKFGDTSYRKREPVPYEYQGYNRGGQDRLINLHGLHVTDALHVLKHELDVLRGTVLSSRQQLQATIFLGPSNKGMRTPARLSMAVEHLLLEDGIPYTQSQPGLLHVVIY